MCSRKGIGPRRVDNPQQVVRPGRCAKEQEKPRSLQIAHCHDPAEKGGVFLVRGEDLGLNMVSVSQRNAQHADSLPTRRQRLVTPPHDHQGNGSPPCFHDMLATNGETCAVPQLRPLVDSDSRVVPQGRLDLCMQKSHAFWSTNNEDVIQEGEQLLARQQRPAGCPHVAGRLAVELQDKRENFVAPKCCWGAFLKADIVDALDIKSNAPTPSTDITVASGSKSVSPWRMWENRLAT